MLAAGTQVVAVSVGTGRDGFGLLYLRVVILAVLSQSVLLRTVLVWNALAVVEDLSEQTDAGVGEACQLLDAQAVLFPEDVCQLILLCSGPAGGYRMSVPSPYCRCARGSRAS